ncbi:hypothetical protein U5817_22990 [Aromatoleum evansii]|uniref:Uncharacterized protein n=1 Tax=Aromatoleum evansii TaxID=59406 RepID=A0ABZ1AJI3_AROEV|nr:hypothetical protein U5817_22990 [Aromatoleum evansii]
MNDATEGSVQFRHEYKVSESSFELIKVADTQQNRDHYLLIEMTNSKIATEVSGNNVIMAASMSAKAYYIFGSCPSFIGELVSDMAASVNGFDKSVRLTNGSVMIRIEDLKGLHIGTYLFYKIVNWVKTNAPGYRVIPISLSNVDASEKNKDRRNTFYENFGLKFEYLAENGVEKASGRSLAILTTDDLIPYQNWPNINVRHLHSGLKDLAFDVDRMRRSLFDAKRSIRSHVRDRKKKDDRLRTLARCINWPLYIFFAFAGIAMGKILS